MHITPRRIFCFTAGYPLLGLRIALCNDVYMPLLFGSLAFVNAWQLNRNLSRTAALWLCLWTLLTALTIREWQIFILTPLSFSCLFIADWRHPQPRHPAVFLANWYVTSLFLFTSVHPF